MNKRNNGITLVALVITIIVLLILAGVSIALVVGDNGVLSQAKSSSEKSIVGREKETIAVSWSALITNKLANNVEITDSTFEQELTNNGNDATVSYDENENYVIHFNDTGHNYVVDGTGKIVDTTQNIPVGGEVTPTGDPIADVVAVGDYVDINVPYTNKKGEETVYEHNGWRVLNVNTETGVVKLISTAHPLTFNHPGSPALDSIAELEKISSEVLTVDSSNSRGYIANGFSTNDVKNLFNNTSIFSEISIPIESDISGIASSNELRKTVQNYWLATANSDNNRLAYVDTTGQIKGGNYWIGGVRPLVTLTPSVTIKDGEGTSATPYRLNGINYN